MDNKDNTKEQKRMLALAKKYEEEYKYGRDCVPFGTSDATTPLGIPFFGVRMLNGDIHNLTGMHRRDRIIDKEYLTSDGMCHKSLAFPRREVLDYYKGQEDVDCIVVIKMLPFTHEGGFTFYTNDWTRPVAQHITPLVEVVAELSGITTDTPTHQWTHQLESVPIPSGEFDLTEVIA